MRRSTVAGVGGALVMATFAVSCANAPTYSGNTQPTSRGGEPNWQAAPSYGTINLSAGFSPDPYLRSIAAGGADEVGLGGSECTGYIHADAPDLDLNYQAGGYQLAIYAKADTDVTLIVNAADGRWYCSDDYSGTNPAIIFSDPPSGNYNIWIGTYRPSSRPLPESVVYISEMEPRW